MWQMSSSHFGFGLVVQMLSVFICGIWEDEKLCCPRLRLIYLLLKGECSLAGMVQ